MDPRWAAPKLDHPAGTVLDLGLVGRTLRCRSSGLLLPEALTSAFGGALFRRTCPLTIRATSLSPNVPRETCAQINHLAPPTSGRPDQDETGRGITTSSPFHVERPPIATIATGTPRLISVPLVLLRDLFGQLATQKRHEPVHRSSSGVHGIHGRLLLAGSSQAQEITHP